MSYILVYLLRFVGHTCTGPAACDIYCKEPEKAACVATDGNYTFSVGQCACFREDKREVKP